MIKFKRWFPLCLVVFIMLLSACSSNEKSESQGVSTGGATNEVVEIDFWHSMGNKNGESLQALVDKFNTSQDKIKVNTIYQGKYEDSLTKLKTSKNSDSTPALYQSNFVSSGPIIDMDIVEPVQTFIDKEGYDLSNLDANILGAFDMDGTLYAMPFNSSTLLMYYNKDAFKAAGLDPESPPKTYEEFEEMASKLSGNGKYAASFGVSAYYIEQLIGVQGAEIVNNGNGRQGLPTESLINSPEAIATFTWWKDMVDKGYMLNLGTATEDAQQAFLSQQTAMYMESTAVVSTVIEGAGENFEVGTAFIPYPEEAEGKGGVSVGGGSLYIINNKSEAEQQAAWEFIKFAMEPEQQAEWHINTGYFPVNNKAYELDIIKENMEKYPQFKTAIRQLEVALENNAGKNAGKGAVVGIYPDMRKSIVLAMEEILNDQKTPEEALNDAAKDITVALEAYNESVQ